MVELMRLVELEEITYKEVDLSLMGIEELKGLYYDNHIYLCKTLKTISEKRCVLAEELGHHFKSFGNIIDQSKVVNVKQENIGRQWAYGSLIPFTKLIEASKQGFSNHFEYAEYLGVTEQFLSDAIRHYRSKYGLYHRVGRYIVYFEPLGVFEQLEAV